VVAVLTAAAAVVAVLVAPPLSLPLPGRLELFVRWQGIALDCPLALVAVVAAAVAVAEYIQHQHGVGPYAGWPCTGMVDAVNWVGMPFVLASYSSWVDLDNVDSTSHDCTCHVASNRPCWPDCSDRPDRPSDRLGSGEWPLGSFVHMACFHNNVGIVVDHYRVDLDPSSSAVAAADNWVVVACLGHCHSWPDRSHPLHFAAAAVVAAAESADVVAAAAAVALASPLSVAVAAAAAVALVVVAAAALADVDFDTGPDKRVAPQCPDVVPSDGVYTVVDMLVVHRAYILENGLDQHIQRNCTIVLHDFPG
jgi:hypothetical protein